MMGSQQEAQGALFYEFSLEAHVPPDHMLRSVDQFVDLVGIRQHLTPFYSSTGRPSVDPELMIRMLLVGYSSAWCCHWSEAHAGRYPVRTPPLRRGASQPRLPLVLPPGSDRPGTGSRPSPRTVTAVSATVTCRGTCSRQLSRDASRKAWPVANAFRSSLTMDQGPWRAGLFCLFHQLPDRHRQRRDPRRGATRAIRQAEVGLVQTMIDRVEDTFGIVPERLIADTA